jgi:hypothetical protein
MPISAEISVASAAAAQPMMTDSCAPWMQRDSRSRPRLSVPNQCVQRGRLQAFERGDVVVAVRRDPGREDAHHQEQQQQQAAGRAQRLVAEQAFGKTRRARRGRGAGGCGAGSTRRPSAVPHLGVEQAVAQVDQQVDQHHRHADDRKTPVMMG